jgi:hypothetical protein
VLRGPFRKAEAYGDIRRLGKGNAPCGTPEFRVKVPLSLSSLPDPCKSLRRTRNPALKPLFVKTVVEPNRGSNRPKEPRPSWAATSHIYA